MTIVRIVIILKNKRVIFPVRVFTLIDGKTQNITDLMANRTPKLRSKMSIKGNSKYAYLREKILSVCSINKCFRVIPIMFIYCFVIILTNNTV